MWRTYSFHQQSRGVSHDIPLRTASRPRASASSNCRVAHFLAWSTLRPVLQRFEAIHEFEGFKYMGIYYWDRMEMQKSMSLIHVKWNLRLTLNMCKCSWRKWGQTTQTDLSLWSFGKIGAAKCWKNSCNEDRIIQSEVHQKQWNSTLSGWWLSHPSEKY